MNQNPAIAVLEILQAMNAASDSESATLQLAKKIDAHLAVFPETADRLLMVIAQNLTGYRNAAKTANDNRLRNALDFMVHLPSNPTHWTAKKHGIYCLRVVEALRLPMDGAADGQHWQDVAVRVAREYAESEDGQQWGGLTTRRRLTAKEGKDD